MVGIVSYDKTKLENRCFARSGNALEKEMRIRKDEHDYWQEVMKKLCDGRVMKGWTPEERSGIRMAIDVFSGKRSPQEVRRALDARARRMRK